MNNLHFITIIIPCLNEENYIGKCLDSVIANDYPKDRLEVLVMDGMSEDGTRVVLERYVQRYPFIKVFDNPKKITPAGLNIGIRKAKGEIIVRMDAHATYEKNYVSKCVKYLNEYNADNVGGVWVTVPRNNSLVAKAIAFSLSHSFGVGNAHYKIGWSKKPKWVDTVPYGCFRKDVFDKIGLFDETSNRNEDIEFNARLRKAGGKILLVPDTVINYFARSTFQAFCKHNFDNGLKITYPFKLNKGFFSWRHLIPFVFVSSLIGPAALSGFFPIFFWLFLLIAGSYSLLNFYFSSKIVMRENDFKYFLMMPIIFASLHIGYGLGSLWGLLKNCWPKGEIHTIAA